MIAVLQQQADDIRRHGRLACSSYREITHTDSGRLDGEREQQTLVIQRVPDGYTERVEPAERNIENAAHLDLRLLNRYFGHKGEDTRLGA